jgi:hypothetical protein
MPGSGADAGLGCRARVRDTGAGVWGPDAGPAGEPTGRGCECQTRVRGAGRGRGAGCEAPEAGAGGGTRGVERQCEAWMPEAERETPDADARREGPRLGAGLETGRARSSSSGWRHAQRDAERWTWVWCRKRRETPERGASPGGGTPDAKREGQRQDARRRTPVQGAEAGRGTPDAKRERQRQDARRRTPDAGARREGRRLGAGRRVSCSRRGGLARVHLAGGTLSGMRDRRPAGPTDGRKATSERHIRGGGMGRELDHNGLGGGG